MVELREEFRLLLRFVTKKLNSIKKKKGSFELPFFFLFFS